MKKDLLVLLFGLVSSLSYAQITVEQLNEAALNRTKTKVTYDGRYIKIPYPNGDVPKHIGVCTDVVVRAYRTVGVDLQQRVHEDMERHFSKYPSKRIWGLNRTDHNIDHRRVPNLQTFFTRHGEKLPISQKGSDYLTGDLVTWRLPRNLPHIGIVTNKVGKSGNPMIVHNIGMGPKLEDMLFDYVITGHYRYLPKD